LVQVAGLRPNCDTLAATPNRTATTCDHHDLFRLHYCLVSVSRSASCRSVRAVKAAVKSISPFLIIRSNKRNQ
jgi:hypothetical protein